jgi:hypothetical protein
MEGETSTSKGIQKHSHMVAVRLFCMLLPALCCSWMALQTTLQYEHDISAKGVERENDRPQYSNVRSSNVSTQALHATQKPAIFVSTTTCLHCNSKEWLDSPRIGNANGDASAFRSLILDVPNIWVKEGTARHILKQSLCHEQSKFLNATEQDEQLWTVRLIYLAVHAHQFLPGLEEAQARHERPESYLDELSNKSIGALDYECPSAKFLVVSLAKSGYGSNVRLGAVPALMAGIATNRVVLFINNAPVGPKFLRDPWTLASCDRRDAQCFFLPASPCVLTEDELSNAYQLQRNEMRNMFRVGQVPPEHTDDRVLIVNLKFRPQRVPLNLRPALHNLSMRLLDHLPNNDRRLPMLQAAANRVLEEDTTQQTTSYAYVGINSPVYHALVLFTVRPNAKYAQQIDGIVEDIMPSDFDPDFTVGLPIRGKSEEIVCVTFDFIYYIMLTCDCFYSYGSIASDKCNGESECLSFPQYMSAVSKIWTKRSNARLESQPETNIVVTTESQRVLRELEEFASNDTLRKSVPFPFRFVTNHRDVAQDTGYLEHIADHPTLTADKAMLSALSSLKAQLATSITVGNCCSNFHLLLSDLLSEGCGARKDSNFQCLQDHDDPEFRICCGWDKSTECRARRNQTKSFA